VSVIEEREPIATVTPAIGCLLIVPTIVPAIFPGPGSSGSPVLLACLSVEGVVGDLPPSQLTRNKSMMVITMQALYKEFPRYILIFGIL
jgi:hypothetical protein